MTFGWPSPQAHPDPHKSVGRLHQGGEGQREDREAAQAEGACYNNNNNDNNNNNNDTNNTSTYINKYIYIYIYYIYIYIYIYI